MYVLSEKAGGWGNTWLTFLHHSNCLALIGGCPLTTSPQHIGSQDKASDLHLPKSSPFTIVALTLKSIVNCLLSLNLIYCFIQCSCFIHLHCLLDLFRQMWLQTMILILFNEQIICVPMRFSDVLGNIGIPDFIMLYFIALHRC